MRYPNRLRSMSLATGLAATLLCSSAALAQGAADAYPSRPVTIVIPFTPGGSTEFEFRPYALKLSEFLGRQFVLDYKGGAGSLLGTAFVAKAAPDGYTLLGTSGSVAVLPSLHANLGYDPYKDLAAVSLMSKKSSLLVIHPGLPANTVKEFVAYAKANPGRINHSTSGAGGSPHLRALYLYSLIGIEPTFIHYKGTGPMTVDLVSGRVNVAITLPTLIIPQMKAGKVRVLGTTGPQRIRLLPDVPTVSESLPGFEFSGWGAMYAPGGTPAAIVNKLSAEMAKVAKVPEIVQRFGEEGWIMVGSTPEELRKWTLDEIEFTRKLIKETGIKIE